MGASDLLKITGATADKDVGMKITQIKEFTDNQTCGVDAAGITHSSIKSMSDSDIIELSMRLHGRTEGEALVVPKSTRLQTNKKIGIFARTVVKFGCRIKVTSDGQPFPGKAAEDKESSLYFRRGVSKSSLSIADNLTSHAGRCISRNMFRS
jgi:hypothetical protein